MDARRLLRMLLATLVLLPAAAARGVQTVELIPDQRAGWGATNLFAPITGWFLGGPGYWYRQRRIEVETTPPGATLDLFYVRANFQKAYEQATAPVVLVLPSRVEAGPRDSVTIRAVLDGFRQQEVHVRVRSRETQVVLDLAPLPNQLVALTHTSLAGRGSLAFVTREALSFRLQERGDAHSVVLLETGAAPETLFALGSVRSGLVESVVGQQVGEDLLVTFRLGEGARASGVELRSRQNQDLARDLHRFSVDLVPADGGAEAVQRARAALARIAPRHVEGCALVFDDALREQLDPADLARALAPRGEFTDPYLRAAVKRLGELATGGLIQLADGTTYRSTVPLELAAAVSQSAEAHGYLALLRQLVVELEAPDHRRETLRGLVAPEVDGARFATILDVAESREQRCRAGVG